MATAAADDQSNIDKEEAIPSAAAASDVEEATEQMQSMTASDDDFPAYLMFRRSVPLSDSECTALSHHEGITYAGYTRGIVDRLWVRKNSSLMVLFN